MTIHTHDDAYEPAHTASQTAHALDELQLYGYRPFDEPDPRPMPDGQRLAVAVADIFDALVATLEDTRMEPDLEEVLWGQVNLFHRATARIERSLDETIGGKSAASLMKAMIVRSDNRATDLLLRNLGGPATVQRWLDWNKVEGMRIDRTIAELLRARRDLYEDLDSSTPLAMATFLKRLDKGELLVPWARNYLVSLMAQCTTGSNRMKALLPPGTVAHKTGTLNGYTSDVGFVRLPDGRRIAIAIFARGGSDRPRAIAEAARAVYDGFRAVVTWPYNAGSALSRQ